MAFKVFLDANILLDFTLKREDYAASKQIIELAVSGEILVFTTPAIVHITAYWLTKTYGKAKSRELLLSLLLNVTIIDANHQVAINALLSKIDETEDALLYFTAIHHKMDFFLIQDKLLVKHAIPALPVYLPAHFLKEIIS